MNKMKKLLIILLFFGFSFGQESHLVGVWNNISHITPFTYIFDKNGTGYISIKDETYEKIISNIQEIKSRKGKIIIVTDSKDKILKELANDLIIVPRSNIYLFVVLATIVLQLFAYHIAIINKRNVDQPRNLAKSVTVE